MALALGLATVGFVTAHFSAPASPVRIAHATLATHVPVMAPRPIEDDHTPYFAVTDTAASSTLYEGRVADQAAPDAQLARIRELRFWLRGVSTRMHAMANSSVAEERWSQAVPLGEVSRHGQRYLAVVTTRCVVDHRYPDAGNAPVRFVNLALFTGPGRAEQVFRLSEAGLPPEFSAVNDPHGRFWRFWARGRGPLESAEGDRYFGVLALHRVPLVEVELVRGNWIHAEGWDAALLYFPLGDPGVAVIQRHSHDDLGWRDPAAVVRAQLDAIESLEGRSILASVAHFNHVSDECLRSIQRQLADARAEDARWRGLAYVAAAVALSALVGPAGLVSLIQHVAAQASLTLGPALSGARGIAWRGTLRVLHGDGAADVIWDETGHLVASFAGSAGPLERVAIAGIHREGLSRADAGRVVATAREFLARDGVTVSQLDADGRETTATAVAPDARMDLAAELLRRGLVRLDTRDAAVLAQQPTLIRAARDALTHDDARDRSAVANPDYQRAVFALVDGIQLAQ